MSITQSRNSDELDGLLAWGMAVRRDLPWRHTRDPWAVLVSEVMLQQTQVARVIPKWTEFLRRWPSATACADASLGEILAVWSGLGYPRRAKYLHEAATVVTQAHDGVVPLDLDRLRSLPGVGPYTARAVMAFAGEIDVAVVDTNIARILARRRGVRLTSSEAQLAADELLTPGKSWEHNQSMMDVGAMLCRPVPECEQCPLSAGCVWHRGGHPMPDPAIGSAGVSRAQAKFAGSDRELRGRILRAVMAAPDGTVAAADIARLITDADRATAVADGLVADGLLIATGNAYCAIS